MALDPYKRHPCAAESESDNFRKSSMEEEFQVWCQERGITHLTGAPYHPETNGAAESLVQTFKHAIFTYTTEGTARIPYAVSLDTTLIWLFT